MTAALLLWCSLTLGAQAEDLAEEPPAEEPVSEAQPPGAEPSEEEPSAEEPSEEAATVDDTGVQEKTPADKPAAAKPPPPKKPAVPKRPAAPKEATKAPTERPTTVEDADPKDIKRDEEGEYILVPKPMEGALELKPGATIEELALAVSGSVVRLYADRGENTVVEAAGFFIAHDQLLVPYHLLERSKSVAYQRPGQADREGIAGVLGADPETDLAVVRLNTPVDAAPLQVRGTPPNLGEQLFVVGAQTGGHPIVIATRVAQAGGGFHLDRPLPTSLAGAAVVDARGQLVGVVQYESDKEAVLGAFIPAPAITKVAALGTPIQEVSAWAKTAKKADIADEIGADELTAGGVFVTTASCLSSCGLLICGVPLVGGTALFAAVGCLSAFAVILSGGSILVQILQILQMPMGMTTLLGMGGSTVLAAAMVLGPATLAASAAPLVPAGFVAGVLGASDALPERPLRQQPSHDERGAVAY